MSTLIDIRTTAAPAAQENAHLRALAPSDVPTHQTLAIVCALVCFAPLGVAAVVSAGQVRTRLALGDAEGARRASRRTLGLCLASATATILFLLVIALGAGSYSEAH